ncbi:MAG TPA: hypothetical protein EYQ00_09715 [Dehalococcoidia bacterium]|jgi:hypothetical protein|nr:hypothetical protein [Dehalococcoidia bacterium]
MARSEIRGGQIKDDSITGDDVDESTLILDTLRDADGDTKVQIEESADEDKIRFDTAGLERLVINSDGGIAFGNASVSGAPASWNFFNFKGGGVRVTASNFYCDNDRGVLWGDSSVSIKGNATAGTESLTVRANYNAYIHVDGINDAVGIGTTAPDRKLDILGTSNPQLRLTQTDGTNYVDLQATAAGDLEITPSNANGHVKISSAENTSLLIQSDNTGDSDVSLGFSINAGSDLQWSLGCDDSDGDKFKIGTSLIETDTRLTIDSAGRVGIGTTTPECTLSVAGSYAANVTGINTSNDPGTTYSVAAIDHILLINTRPTAQGGIDSAITITLPAAASFAGRVLTFKDAGGYADVNGITIQRAGLDTIDGTETSLSIPQPAAWFTFVSDGTSNWFEIS